MKIRSLEFWSSSNSSTPGLRGPNVPSQSSRHRGERHLLGDPGHKSGTALRKMGTTENQLCMVTVTIYERHVRTNCSNKLPWMLLKWWEHYVLASSTLQSWSSAWLTWTCKWTLQASWLVCMGLALVWGKASNPRYKHSIMFISCRCLFSTCM